jgi:hypothetical protein
MNDKDSNNISRTNWAALESNDDATIDYSDIPPLTDRFFENATLRILAAQAKRLGLISNSKFKNGAYNPPRTELRG